MVVLSSWRSAQALLRLSLSLIHPMLRREPVLFPKHISSTRHLHCTCGIHSKRRSQVSCLGTICPGLHDIWIHCCQFAAFSQDRTHKQQGEQNLCSLPPSVCLLGWPDAGVISTKTVSFQWQRCVSTTSGYRKNRTRAPCGLDVNHCRALCT